MEVSLSNNEFIRYSRQLILPEIGKNGQEKLKESSVLIIGAGGLGSPASLYLAGSGIGNIGIVDFDPVEITNLHRQVLHGSKSLGRPKVESARERLLDINSDINIAIYNEPFSSSNAKQISEGYDVIIDGTDNFPARYLINDISHFLKIPFVYGSVFKFEGQVSVFNFNNGPCYRCIFPEPPPPGLIPNCEETGVLGVIPGTIGLLQATETLKILLDIGTSLSGRLLIYDALDLKFDSVKLKKNSTCKLCGANPSIKELIDYDEFCGYSGIGKTANVDELIEINPDDLYRRIKQNKNLILVDIREPHELEISSILGAVSIPLSQLSNRMNEISNFDEIVLFCRTGNRSKRGVKILEKMGVKNVFHLKGGINAWAKEIDPKLIIY